MTEREHSAHTVQHLQLALVDATLFLDTHPDNPAALNYFQRMQEQYQKAKDEFESHFGPLTHAYDFGEKWSWIDGPWPWEGGK